MDLSEIIRSLASRFVHLDDEDITFLAGRIEFRKFEKRQMLIREGEKEKYLNYVISGLVRKFFHRRKEEMIMLFAKESEFISCYDSFLSGEPSMYSVETLEPTMLASITRQNLESLYEYSPKFERLGRMLVTDLYLKRENSDYDRIRLRSQERFVKFIRDNADLLQRAPQKFIASYLNMKPETFSRLKHLTKKPVER